MQPMTQSQKNLADACGKHFVDPGEIVFCQIDLALANDVTAAPAIDQFNKLGLDKVWDKAGIALVPDHFTPNKDIKAAQMCRKMQDFAAQMGIVNYLPMGTGGIEHIILPQKGLVRPSMLIIGADSHTCTYGALGAFATGVGSTDLGMAMATGRVWLKVPTAIRISLSGELPPYICGKDLILQIIGVLGVEGARYRSLEFDGPGVAALSMADRLTICNMAVECGAKNALFPVDDKTLAFLAERSIHDVDYRPADADAPYDEEYSFSLDELKMTVAAPYLPSNIKDVDELGDVKLDQVVIGSCTNGRIEDMRQAADVLRGRKVADGLRCLIIPGSQEVYRKMLQEDLADIFIDAGAVITMPTCGPCIGGHCGVLSGGEKALATTNRNFVGRMGDKTSQVYLAGPACAAASAVAGFICHPQNL